MKKIFIILIGIILLVSSYSVFAEGEEVHLNTTKMPTVIITGEGFENDAVTLIVFSPDYTESTVITKDNLSSYVKYTYEILPDSEGKFNHTFRLGNNELEDKYPVVIKVNDEVISTEELYYISESANEMITQYFVEQNADIAALLEKYTGAEHPALNLTLDEYYAANKTEICNLMKEQRTEMNDGQGLKNLKDVEMLYSQIVLSKRIYTANSNEIDILLQEFADVIGIAIDDFYIENKESVINRFKALITNEDNTLSDIADVYNEAYFIEQINKETSITSVDNLVRSKIEKMSFTETKYNSYTNPNLGSYIIPADISSYADLDAKVNQFMIARDNQANNANNNNGSSGGSGNRESPVYVLPFITDQVNKEDINKDRFVDIQNVSWAKEAINALADKGVISGKSANEFFPADNILREEFTKIIVGAFELSADNKKTTFDDVSEKEWYSQFINIASVHGIVKGIDKNIFGVGKNISRQDIAVMIVRTLEHLEIEIPIKREYIAFKDDNSISDYACDAVKKLYCAGIINGNDTGEFLPTDFCTRAEGAKMIYGALILK